MKVIMTWDVGEDGNYDYDHDDGGYDDDHHNHEDNDYNDKDI